MKQIFFTTLSTLLVLCLAGSTLYAAPILVDCNRGGSISATLASLAQSGNTRGVTIFVKGTCKENITIIAFDHLVLQGAPIATLQDTSNGSAPIVTLSNSYDVLLQGFTINGGSSGVACFQDSFCTLYLNTIQQSSGEGVRVARASALLVSNNILSNAGRGVSVVNDSKLHSISNTINHNGGPGVLALSGSYLFAENDTIESNPVGVLSQSGSVVRFGGLTISNNTGDGVRLESSSTASFGDNVITGNGGNGVAIHDLSFASFAGDNISGNLTQPDVACYAQFSATRGAGTVGGTTDCTEPSSPVGKK